MIQFEQCKHECLLMFQISQGDTKSQNEIQYARQYSFRE